MQQIHPDVFGLDAIALAEETARIAETEIGLSQDCLEAIRLYAKILSAEDGDSLLENAGAEVAKILRGLLRVQELYTKTPVIETENFRNLLLTFAEDMRVILIMIADRVCLMRAIRDVTDVESRRKVAHEANYLYAPLAHKLGLYTLKSELEDLSLKYLEHDAYYHIKDKLSATKSRRDKYITDFIGPVKAKLEAAGLKFHIKGRTKSIHSIWQKMQKQQCPFEGVYDLFAIRIILDSEKENEKRDCWQAYSIVTDMYQPNPKRLRDWLSVPKSNGYESLHITVLGPEQKWVEVQIRTERMDDVAEHGLAAHWRYKGVKAGGGMDEWLAAIRGALEAGDDMQVMDQFKMELYEDEVYVFTPKGEIRKFAVGATVLDFAYLIHSHVGNQCVGAKINGRIVPIREELHSGDTVEILTSSTQTPKQDWLNIVRSSHARTKIRKALNELNKEPEEYVSAKAEATAVEEPQQTLHRPQHTTIPPPWERQGGGTSTKGSVIMDDRNLQGSSYTMARCCMPLNGDDIFGFITVTGDITIHRCNCPNAQDLHRRYGYRVIGCHWAK